MEYNYLKGVVDGHPQIATHFPNDNSKRIDYVILYKYEKKLDENRETDRDDSEMRKTREEFGQKEALRQKFIHRLQEEGFNVAPLRRNHRDRVDIYLLLNCSIERLLDEAEKSKLEMRLKNVRKFLIDI